MFPPSFFYKRFSLYLRIFWKRASCQAKNWISSWKTKNWSSTLDLQFCGSQDYPHVSSWESHLKFKWDGCRGTLEILVSILTGNDQVTRTKPNAYSTDSGFRSWNWMPRFVNYSDTDIPTTRWNFNSNLLSYIVSFPLRSILGNELINRDKIV